MKQRLKKILGSVLTSTMMFSMISSLGIVTQAAVIKDATITLDISPRMDVYKGLNYFEVKGVKSHSNLKVNGYSKKLHTSLDESLIDNDRLDRYPLEVTVELQVKPDCSDTISSIKYIEVSDALQYATLMIRDNQGLTQVSSESQLKPNSYCFMDSAKTTVKVDFILIPYVLELYNKQTNQRVADKWFYGVAGSFYAPKASKLLPESDFPEYKNRDYKFEPSTYQYSSPRFAIGSQNIGHAQMRYTNEDLIKNAIFGGFGYSNYSNDYGKIAYKNGNSFDTAYISYDNVLETITYSAYYMPSWTKKVYPADCYNPKTIEYTSTSDSSEVYYEYEGDPLEHNYVHKSDKDIPATLTTPAKEYWECTLCHDHEYRDGAKATTKEGKIGEFNYVFDNKNDAGILTIDDVMPIEIPDCATPAAEIADFSSLVKKIVFKSGKTTAIGDNAFAGLDNSAFTSVTLPANVTRIGYSSFADSKALKTVTFNGNNLETIGERAFFGTSLKEVTIPKSVT
ncbi:MAG: leucine-rich repeat domain-containing protein, partial [Clostridiales bacterium]|nr:leucine-rich repeat domain-containing protein [Clostridiales bacterium]